MFMEQKGEMYVIGTLRVFLFPHVVVVLDALDAADVVVVVVVVAVVGKTK